MKTQGRRGRSGSNVVVMASSRNEPAVPPRRRRSLDGPQWIEAEERAALIAEAAYYRALARGFQPGHEVADWLAAEQEIDSKLQAERQVQAD